MKSLVANLRERLSPILEKVPARAMRAVGLEPIFPKELAQRRLLQIAIRENVVFIPVMAKTDAGFYTMVEPVAVVNEWNPNDLRPALRKVLEIGNPRVPTPKRSDYEKQGILPTHAHVRSWRIFDRTSAYFSVTEHEGFFKICSDKTWDGNRGWVPAAPTEENFPEGLSLDEAADHLAAYIRARVRWR